MSTTSQLTLTIAVPTYNRADKLELLLNTLLVELRGLEGRVAVVIGDNASTDRTPDLLAQFETQWADTTLLRHPENLGMDGNFCGCVGCVKTPYFWVIGDDDLPRSGAVSALIVLLERESPDLVYLRSRWLRQLHDNNPSDSLAALKFSTLDRLAFARRTNVWTTYLSGMVVRSPVFIHNPVELNRFAGTQLSQLAWVLAALRDGDRFVYVHNFCVLATASNTGGYKVLQVFGRNFPDIVRAIFGEVDGGGQLCRAILLRTVWTYLPTLVWGLRQSKLGRFDHEDAADVLRFHFGKTLAFKALLMPIAHAPAPVALTALLVARIAGLLISVLDVLSETVRRVVRAVQI
jgi:glycosyltransferase involved in cell wall biosynthesis